MNEVLNEIEANEVTERDNLAVVYIVERLEAIPNKDRIELVHLKDCGYTCVCEKRHAVGDKVVFVKFDTIVPANELFSWMADCKYRVKQKSFTERDEDGDITKKIYSQGIVLKLSEVIDFTAKRDCSHSEAGLEIDKMFQTQLWDEGDDVTNFLEIKKYIAPVSGGMGNMTSKGDFPTHLVSKTDELNICSKVRALEELQGQAVYITQKIEGSSVTFYLDDTTGELVVCSRNNMLLETETSKFWQGVNKHDVYNKLVNYPWLVCQAELYGSGIQKNKLGIEGVDIMVFNMIDKRTRMPLGFLEMIELNEELGLPLVPLVGYTESFDLTFDQLQELADHQKYANGVDAEGLVVRPFKPFMSKILKQLWSVKCINRDYKL